MILGGSSSDSEWMVKVREGASLEMLVLLGAAMRMDSSSGCLPISRPVRAAPMMPIDPPPLYSVAAVRLVQVPDH